MTDVLSMKRLYFLFMIILATQISWAQNFSEYSKKIIPEKLQSFKFSTSKTADVQKTLGDAKQTKQSGQETTLFYNLNGVDFDTSLGFKSDKLVYIYLSHIPGSLSFLDFEGLFSKADIETALKEMNKVKGHEKGRYFELTHKKEGLRLRFQNTDKKLLLSATVWTPGQAKP